MVNFTIRDPATGRVKTDSSTPTLLFFGIVSIGGPGSAQQGNIVDDRFRWGVGFVSIISGGFTPQENLAATYTFNDNVLTWRYPMTDATSANRAPVTFIYGVKP